MVGISLLLIIAIGVAGAMVAVRTDLMPGKWGKALDITYLIIVALGLLLALGTIVLAWMDSPTL